MRMLLLISAMVLLVSPAVARHTHPHFDANLNKVFDLAGKVNQSLMKEFFVEDVSELAGGTNKCQLKFFCKVYDILHEHFNKSKDEKELVRNLKMFISGRTSNCTELLKDVTPTDLKIPIPDFVGFLTRCIQHRNINGTNSNPHL